MNSIANMQVQEDLDVDRGACCVMRSRCVVPGGGVVFKRVRFLDLPSPPPSRRGKNHA